MATKPSTAANTVPDGRAAVSAIVNETPELAQPLAARGAVTANADGTYAVSGDTDAIHAIGDYIMSFEPAQNAFLNALVNRIGLTIVTSRLYRNPWANFKRGYLDFGETVEEIYVNLARPFQFSPDTAEKNVFKRELPDVRAAFHTMNFQKYYKVTISNDQLRQAFLSWQGISDLISRIVETLYTSMETDEYYIMKYMLAKSLLNGYVQSVDIPAATAENAKEIAANFRAVSNLLEFQSTKYTMSGVTTHTPKDEQFLIIDARFEAVMDMNALASAFNLDYAEFMGKIVRVDSLVEYDWNRLTELFTDASGKVDPNFHKFTEDELTTLGSVPATLVSRNFWMIWDNFQNMTQQYNGEGLYWNYWYHVWKTFSVSPFGQAVAFSSQPASITSVTVDPATATLSKGASLQLAPKVVAAGVINKSVTWSIAGAASSGTYVSDAGLVHIAKDETSATVTVSAASIADPTKTANCVITVSGNAGA